MLRLFMANAIENQIYQKTTSSFFVKFVIIEQEGEGCFQYYR